MLPWVLGSLFPDAISIIILNFVTVIVALTFPGAYQNEQSVQEKLVDVQQVMRTQEVVSVQWALARPRRHQHQ